MVCSCCLEIALICPKPPALWSVWRLTTLVVQFRRQLWHGYMSALAMVAACRQLQRTCPGCPYSLRCSVCPAYTWKRHGAVCYARHAAGGLWPVVNPCLNHAMPGGCCAQRLSRWRTHPAIYWFNCPRQFNGRIQAWRLAVLNGLSYAGCSRWRLTLAGVAHAVQRCLPVSRFRALQLWNAGVCCVLLHASGHAIVLYYAVAWL